MRAAERNKRIMSKNNIRRAGSFFLLLLTLLGCFLLPSCGKEPRKEFNTLDDLRGCTFANADGNSSYEPNIEKDIPGVQFARYTNYFDTFIAVANGNADAAFCFKYTFIGLKEAYPGLRYVETDFEIPIVANFSAEADALRQDFNAFLAEAKQNGLLDRLAEKWMYGYDELGDGDWVDFRDLNANGTVLKVAWNVTNVPYDYLRSGKTAGYEPALVYEFCKARGYRPEITETAYDSVVAGVASGKYQMGVGAYGYTDERDESSHFSDPIFTDRVVYVVNGEAESQGFWDAVKGSFERTFVRQDRWKLYVDGMLTTLLITVLSVVIGAAVGFAVFLLSQKSAVLTKISYGINDTLEALPILVVLMVFFYVFFGKSDVSGTFVSVLVFGLSFAFSFFVLLCNSVRGIPKEQTEAGLALGYSRWQTLFKVVLPQATEAFVPGIRSAIVALLKGTAVVGYVAVQDLTKAGDLVRSQTFEAFLPIITVAILYFLLAKLLILLLNRLLVTPGERRRRKQEGRK